MKKKRINCIFVIVCMALLVGFMLPSPVPADPKGPPYDKELVMVVESMGTGAALPHTGTTIDLSLWLGLYEFLLARNHETGEAEANNSVTERWELSDDFKKYTFFLRKGIQFHEGWGELTAEDVKFSYDLVMRKDSLSARLTQFSEFVDKVVVENPYKISFHLKKPVWAFPGLISNLTPALPIVCKKYVETVGEKKANEMAIGSGPYRMIDRRAGDFVKFEAVKDHWRKTPDFKYLTIRSVSELSTRLAMYRTGEADIIMVPFEHLNALKKAGFRTINSPGGMIYWVVLGSQPLATHPKFDPNVPWWADPADSKAWERALKVRKAMNLAVDRQKINERLFLGMGTVLDVSCFDLPGKIGGHEEVFPIYPYNPAEAKRLLSEAGYPNGFEVTIILLRHGGRPEAADLGEVVAIYWENIGLKVNRRPMDFATLRPMMYERTMKNPWVFGTASYEEAIDRSYRGSNSEMSFLVGVEHPLTDELVRRAYFEPDFEKRRKIAQQFGKFTHENYINVPLVAKPIILGVSDKVGEWPVVPGYGNFTMQQVEYITVKR